MKHTKRTGIFLLDPFSARNFLFTSIWDELQKCEEHSFVLATDSREHQEFIQASGNPHVDWVYLGRPTPLSAALADFKKKPQLDTLVQLASGGMENTKVSIIKVCTNSCESKTAKKGK